MRRRSTGQHSVPGLSDLKLRRHTARPLLAFAIALMLAFSASMHAEDKKPSSELLAAKSVYLDNETGNPEVLRAATDEFTQWGRFTIVSARADAEVVAKFTYKKGIDRWGNVGFTVLEVFLKGGQEGIFQAKSAAHPIWSPQFRTLDCIERFERLFEVKQ